MQQWLAKPRRANGYAVVASILIMAGVVVLSLRWASIDTQALDAPAMEELAHRLAQLHADAVAAGDDAAWTWSSADEAAFELSSALQVDRLVVYELGWLGLVLEGADAREVEPLAAVGHLFYADAGSGIEPLSVFLLPNRGAMAVSPTLPVPDGRDIWMRWQDRADDAVKTSELPPIRAMLGSDQTMVYMVMSRNPELLEEATARIGELAHRP